MKSIIVDGRFFRSVRAFAEAVKIPYNKVLLEHVHAGGRPYFFNGHFVRLATELEAATLEPGDYASSVTTPALEGIQRRAGGPLITRPVTVGISTNWGDRA